MQGDGTIRVAVVGVGNCCSALVQGVHYYSQAGRSGTDGGVSYPLIGGYAPSAIRFVAAWDVDARKVGVALNEAIFSPPNCCFVIDAGVRGAAGSPTVRMAPVLDGVAPHMLAHEPASRSFRLSAAAPDDAAAVVAELRRARADVLINYLPVGSQAATEFWAEAALAAGVPFLNCIPVFIASDAAWEARFVAAGLPLIGDDMRSQFGASVLSQMLQELAFDRGHTVQAHIQQNVGGNTDFLNMCDKTRLASKKISKENVIRSQNTIRGVPTEGSFLFAGPSDYIAHYGDTKVATFRLELKGFGGAPVIFDARLQVEDSPNSAGVVIDAIRFLKVAREMGICGALRGASAFTQKTPPQQLMFRDAKAECDALAQRELTDKTRGQVVDKATLDAAAAARASAAAPAAIVAGGGAS
jgi:myo-inositol-1-phosphate synthase